MSIFDRFIHREHSEDDSSVQWDHVHTPVLSHWINVTPVESTDRPCTVSELDVKARVSGIYAEVEATITIHNPNKRPISAELEVPLPDRAVICGYALEIDGRMVDGVVVPKEKARVIFETEQRRLADPGLVEAVRGNVYSTRVYPVPPHATRKVSLAYVAPLILGTDGSATIDLPMPDAHLDKRSIYIEVEPLEGGSDPVIKGLGGKQLKLSESLWSLDIEESDVTPTEPVRVAVPDLPDSFVLLEVDKNDDMWFCASTKEEVTPLESAPDITSLTVLWDASGSRGNADHTQELELLKTYASAETMESITLVVFADRVREMSTFSMAEELVDHVAKLRYDGGTDLTRLSKELESLETARAGINQGSACVLFTDGLDTLALDEFLMPEGCSVLSIVSGMQRDAEALRQGCRGPVLDISQAPKSDRELAALLVGARRFGVSGVTGSFVGEICDVSAPAGGRRAVIGRVYGGWGKVRLSDDSEELELEKSDATEGDTLSLAWAARRITLLSPRASEHTDELEKLGKRYGMASPVTSLLVLETFEQYLRYDIEPPESLPEIREAWKDVRRGQMRLGSNRQRARDHRTALESAWSELKEWWKRDYSVVEQIPGMQICRQCGAVVPSEWAYCNMCGARLSINRPDDTLVVEEGMADAMMAASEDASDRPHYLMADDAPQMAYAAASPMGSRQSLRSEMLAASAGPGAANVSSSAGPSMGVSVKPWAPDTPYLKALDEAAENDEPEAAREVYFAQRDEYRNSPSFYLDCATWFMAHEDADFGITVLTNLAELRIEDAALLRVMAWRLREAGKLEMAVTAFRRAKNLRGEDSQSYRDLALTLGELAREKFEEGDKDRAWACLSEASYFFRVIVMTPWDRHDLSIGLFAIEEHNVLKAWAESQDWGEYPGTVNSLGSGLEGVLDCDLRITLAWDADETDVDIHVTEPSGEEAYYRNRNTMMGGHVSEDIRDGYGPELYEIRRAQPGDYVIRAHYYASHQQTIFGPATCTLTIYSDWGRPNQTQTITTVRLDNEHEMLPVGTATYSAPPAEEVEAPSERTAQSIELGMSAEQVSELFGGQSGEEHTASVEVKEWTLDNGYTLCVYFLDGKVIRMVERTPWGEEMVLRT